MFPDIKFEYTGQESIPEITYDNITLDITKYINDIFRYWEQRKHKETAKLSIQDINNIVNFFRGDFVFAPMLSDRLDSVEQKLIRLTMSRLSLCRHYL